MQIQILMPEADGKYYPNWDELIKNARDNDEREYLTNVKERHLKWKEEGYDSFDGFAFGLIYTQRMACGHYEIFQHPIYRKHGCDPTENDVIQSVQDVLNTMRSMRTEKCTSCVCGWN